MTKGNELMNVKSVFIVWYNYSQRAEVLAAELGGQVSFQYEPRLKGLWLTPLRYLVQGWKTWRLLEQKRPEIVIVQAPPITAPLAIAIWCRLRGKTQRSGQGASYVIDGLTGAFHDPKWRWSHPLLRMLSRGALVTLVTDKAALGMLQRWKANSLFLLNGLPTLSPPVGLIGSEGEARVAVISTFSGDEPIAEVFAAARLLPQVTFYLTGDPKRGAPALLVQKPDNVVLTGFLQGGDYSGLLKNVHALAVLTNESHAINCGIYEALAMAKPTIVSDWPGLRHYFSHGLVFVNNTPEAIAAGINKMLNEQAILTNEVIAMRSELAARRQPKLKELAALLIGGER
jgi:glycosyltransferase involved in cell wall biosynthesis